MLNRGDGRVNNLVGKPLNKSSIEDSNENFKHNLLWLIEAIDEKLFKIKILSDNSFRYHLTTEDQVDILYIPLIPNYIIKKHPKIELTFVNEGKAEFELDVQKFGYVIPEELKLPKNGLCYLPNSVINQLRFHVNHKKKDLKSTLTRFLSSLNSRAVKWRFNYLKGQIENNCVLANSGLKLEIIEGEAGTGKSENILRKFRGYNGRVAIIVNEIGAIQNLKERSNHLEIFYYNDSANVNNFRNEFENAISNSETEFDLKIQKIRDEWKELIKKPDLSSFLSAFAPGVAVKEKDLSYFSKNNRNHSFHKVFIDDSNNFHPWNILEILPLSKDVTITGDNSGQLFAKKDFEYLAHRLQLQSTQKSSGSKFDPKKSTIKKMNLDEPLSAKDYVHGNMRRLAKTIRSGLSFPRKVKIDTEIEEHHKKVIEFKNRSLFSIFKDWPTEIDIRVLTDVHRYKGEYKKLLAKLNITSGPFSNINPIAITGKIFLPLSFIDIPQSNGAEVKVGKSRSTRNSYEAKLICDTAKEIHEKLPNKKIMIMAGYGAQIKEIENNLKGRNLYQKIEVLHVDSSSSREKDIVILSLTRNNLTQTIGHMGESNRITMMLKRAIYGIIVIGSSSTFIHKDCKGERRLVERLRKEANILGTYQSDLGGSI